MSRRIQRIYPVFIVVFAIYVALSFLFPAENKIPGTFLEGTKYLLENFILLPGIFPIPPLITVAWSLSYEMLYYLMIPIIIAVFGMRHRSSAWRAVFFLLVASATIVYCAQFGGHVRLSMFVSGVLLHEAMNSPSVPVPGNMFALSALITGLAVLLLPLEGLGPYGGYALKIAVLCLVFFALCFSCFRDPEKWLPRSFSWAPLRWLGNMSYSYYLLHGLALKASFLVLGKVMPTAQGAILFWILLPTLFIFTLIAAAALFLVIESPFSLKPSRVKRVR